MRGGTYAWRVAEKKFLDISWINTESCMPLWGADMKLPQKRECVLLR